MLFEKDDAFFVGTAPFGRDAGEIVRELVEANGLFGIGEIEFDGLPEIEAISGRNPFQFVAAIRHDEFERRRTDEFC